jgi:hypothetical protein
MGRTSPNAVLKLRNSIPASRPDSQDPLPWWEGIKGRREGFQGLPEPHRIHDGMYSAGNSRERMLPPDTFPFCSNTIDLPDGRLTV